jgi:hypothetical protein
LSSLHDWASTAMQIPRHCRLSPELKVAFFFEKINLFFQLWFASTTIRTRNPRRVKSSMAQQQWRRLRHLTRMQLADSDFTRTSRPPWVVGGTRTRRLKHWLLPDGPLFQIILSKTFYDFPWSDYFRALYGHSSIGLDDHSMLLLGGYISGSEYQTGIWQIKEEVWSKVGELTQVWNVIMV